MTSSQDGPEADREGAADLTSTIELLDRYKRGDNEAVSLLVERSLPPLKRWARGRLPDWARSLAETQDLIQDAVIRAIPHLKHFEARHPGALQAYLRQAVVNRVRDEVRRTGRRPELATLGDEAVFHGPSPLEEAVGAETLARYDAALVLLSDDDREAVVARVEMGSSYLEIAEALGKPSADAARVAVSRALVRLAEHMRQSAPRRDPS